MMISYVAANDNLAKNNISQANKKNIAKLNSNLKNEVNGSTLNTTLSLVPASVVLAQRPNVSFGKPYGDPYSYYTGIIDCNIEMEKWNLSKEVERFIENKDYLSAIKAKLELAGICKK